MFGYLIVISVILRLLVLKRILYNLDSIFKIKCLVDKLQKKTKYIFNKKLVAQVSG